MPLGLAIALHAGHADAEACSRQNLFKRCKKHMGIQIYQCLYDKRKRREHLDQIWESGLG